MSNKDKNSNVDFFKSENDKLIETQMAINATSLGKIELNGNIYTKVSKRVEVLRSKFGFSVSIRTEIAHMDEKRVLVKAMVSIYKDGQWMEVANGHAEEDRNSSQINKHSATENAETSAIGRALACLGLSGDEYASADELLKTLSESGSDDTINSPKVKKPEVSEAQISYIIKLIEKTATDTDRFLKHYNVKSIKELTASQANNAIEKLRKKEPLNASLRESDKKAQKNESESILDVINENKKESEKKNVNYKSIDMDENTETVVEHSLDSISENNKKESIEEKEIEVLEEEKKEIEVLEEEKNEFNKGEDLKIETEDSPIKIEVDKIEVDAVQTETAETKELEELKTKEKEDLEKTEKQKEKKKSKSSKKSKQKEPELRETVGDDLTDDDEILM